MSLLDEIDSLISEVKEQLQTVTERRAVEELKVTYLGRKGRLTNILRGLSQLTAEARPAAGAAANKAREELEAAFEAKLEQIGRAEQLKQLGEEAVDISLPARQRIRGSAHALTQVISEIESIFVSLGYWIAEGPEMETDWYNFEALNMPPEHPARSTQDTLYVATDLGEQVLRTHTSPVQVRIMEKHKPPLFVISPGRVFRRDVTDPSHSPMFHQVEGLAVAEDISFADLKGTLETFIKKMFGAERKVRLRPHFFPYTEPSAEVDVSCAVCGGSGCRVCGGNGWLEILGCGMVDPNVFTNVGWDPDKLTGFAFGMGVERIAMLKYGVNDIRLFFENDKRFLEQF